MSAIILGPFGWLLLSALVASAFGDGPGFGAALLCMLTIGGVIGVWLGRWQSAKGRRQDLLWESRLNVWRDSYFCDRDDSVFTLNSGIVETSAEFRSRMQAPYDEPLPANEEAIPPGLPPL